MASVRPVGRAFSPLDKELGLTPGTVLGPRLVEGLVRLSVWMPFAQAARLLEHFTGVRVSEETARRQCLAAGTALVQAETEMARWVLAELPEPGGEMVAHQQVSVDGVMVPLLGEWAEVKTLAIGVVQPPAGGAQARSSQVSYFCRLSDAATFTELATLETHRRATAHAGRVTAVVDGAEWIQEFLAVQCPQATRVLDWAHASGHLAEAATALFSEPSQRETWRKARVRELLEVSPEAVIAELEARAAGVSPQSEAAQVLSSVLGYLGRRRDQVRYASFRRDGLPIGSGMVESANKLVVQSRLKGAGMRWRRENVNGMLALRGLDCSQRWATTWPLLHRYRCRRAVESAHARFLLQHPPSPPAHRPPRVIAGRPSHDHPWRRFRLPGSRPRAKL